MKRIKTFVALGLSLAMLVSVTACEGGGEEYSDYYTFDIGSITSELLYGSEMKIDPVVKNLGTVVDANYKVSVTLDGKDVTSSVYNKDTKMFAPEQQADAIGTYTFNLTIVDDKGNNVLDENGKTFSTSFNVDYCIMNFVPKANAGQDVTVNNDDPLSPVITFADSYAEGSASAKTDSGQYRLTGVNFAGDFEIIYKINATAVSKNEETRFFFGFDRTDENKRDDNIALNVNDGRLSSWFFQDYGQAGGDDWGGMGWTNTFKSVQDNVMDGNDHLIGFTRIISTSGNAYYVVTWDGDYFTTLNVRGNWTDVMGGVWVESVNAAGSIEVASYRTLKQDTSAPALALNYDDVGVGSEVNLKEGLIVIDEVYNATSGISWSVTDPDGEKTTVTGGVLTCDKGGVYTVSATVTDLKGNANTKSSTVNVYSDFTVKNFGLDKFYKAGDQISVTPTFSSDDSAMIAATEAELYKGNTKVDDAVTGDAATGFKFTPAESGVYTLRVSKVTAGRDISKEYEFTVSGSGATDIDMSRNTATARTNHAFIIYGDGATLSVFKGETLNGATDVTANIVDTYVTTTLEENETYTYFRPAEAGTYYIIAEKGEEDSYTLRASKVTVSGDVLRIYDDEKIDNGNGNLDKTIWGNNEMIFLNKGVASYETSKGVWDLTTLATGSFAIQYDMSDLSFAGENKKVMCSLLLDGWCDFFIEGARRSEEKSEFWGYGCNFPQVGWMEYQWRSIWQNKTDEFVPDNDSDYEGEGSQYAVRQGDEYAMYLTGKHTYRVEFILKDESAKTYEVRYFIDGRPEVTHRNVVFGGTTLSCLVINTQSACGVLSNLQIIDDLEPATAD